MLMLQLRCWLAALVQPLHIRCIVSITRAFLAHVFQLAPIAVFQTCYFWSMCLRTTMAMKETCNHPFFVWRLQWHFTQFSRLCSHSLTSFLRCLHCLRIHSQGSLHWSILVGFWAWECVIPGYVHREPTRTRTLYFTILTFSHVDDGLAISAQNFNLRVFAE